MRIKLALDLRGKIVISTVAVILLLGASAIFIIRGIFPDILKAELKQKGVAIGRGLAVNSTVGVLTQSRLRLKELVSNERKIGKDVAYAFIVDLEGQVLAHSFEKGFPEELLAANNVGDETPYNIQTLDTEKGLIYDVAVPILVEKTRVGIARVGILQEDIIKTIGKITFVLLAVTVVTTVMGGLITFTLSNLKKTIQEVKRLSSLEEKNKLAMQLHDGLAQSLASVVMRLELCQKLFERAPQQALEELNKLKETARDLVREARSAINDLKGI